MRRIACALVALALLVSAASAEVSGNALGLRVLERMTDGTENAAVSPLSLALALSMAREGAAGETLRELDELLAGEDIDMSALPPQLRSANAGFVHPGLTLHEDYRARVDAKWFELTDSAQEDVNAWVEDMTDGLIPQVLDEAPDEDTLLLLINALAMDAEWLDPFEENATFADTFFAPSGEIEVDFMHSIDYYRYQEKDGAQLIRLPYAHSTLAMYIALPEAGGVPELLAALADDGLGYFGDLREEEKSEVFLSLPKFSLSAGGSMLDVLKALGMEIACEDFADFSRMGNGLFKIGDVIQKVRIDVDEAGTRAAAATVVEILPGAAPMQQEPIEMTVDRPFVLLIADEATGAIAFSAVVAEI